MPISQSPKSVKCSLKMAEGTLKTFQSYKGMIIMEFCQERYQAEKGLTVGQGSGRCEDITGWLWRWRRQLQAEVWTV